MKRTLSVVIFLIAFSLGSQAQNSAHHKIALFAPLYLDSAFDASGNYRFDKNFPRYFNPGLEFYEGAQMALDSLKSLNMPLDVYVFDTRSREPLAHQLGHSELKDVDLIIAESNAAETRLLANEALSKKVPFVSATLPNDAGITNNPNFVILNATLQTHVEGIYRFLQKYHPLDRIMVFGKPGYQEDQIKDYLTNFSKTTASVPLNIRYVNADNNLTLKQLAKNLDSTKRNVCIAASLDMNFANNLLEALTQLSKTYPITVIGMPTWENLNFTRPELSNLEIIYSTPFYYTNATPLEEEVATQFSNNIGSRPTDMFYRGYETTLHFALLLMESQKDIASNISSKKHMVFTPFDIQPVFKDQKAMTLDYFENKHLYFIKAFGGVKNILY